MKPEIRAKKDKCTLVASVDHGKLRVLGASDDPIVVLEGQVLELRASAGQVHVVQRDTPLSDRSHQGSGHRREARPNHHRQPSHQRKASDGAEAPSVRDLGW